MVNFLFHKKYNMIKLNYWTFFLRQIINIRIHFFQAGRIALQTCTYTDREIYYFSPNENITIKALTNMLFVSLNYWYCKAFPFHIRNNLCLFLLRMTLRIEEALPVWRLEARPSLFVSRQLGKLAWPTFPLYSTGRHWNDRWNSQFCFRLTNHNFNDLWYSLLAYSVAC